MYHSVTLAVVKCYPQTYQCYSDTVIFRSAYVVFVSTEMRRHGFRSTVLFGGKRFVREKLANARADTVIGLLE